MQVAAFRVRRRDTEPKSVTEFSRAQIDDARRLILARYGEIVEPNRDSIYGSTVDAIRAAAFELVVGRQLTLDWPGRRCPRPSRG